MPANAHQQPDDRQWSWRLIAWIAITAIAYFVSARLGLWLAFEHQNVSAVWPPTGVAIAALLLLGFRAWTGVLIGALAANYWVTDVGLTTAGAIACGNTLEALAVTWAARRVAGGGEVFDRAWNIARYVFLAAPLGVTISASIGVSALLISGSASPETAPRLWLTWWLGDVVGALVVAPLIVLWLSRPLPRINPRRILEGAALILLAAGVLLVVFGGMAPQAFQQEFFLIPPLAWAVFRFAQRGAITIAAGMSACAIWATIKGHGPFLEPDLNTALLVVQAYSGIVTVTSLAIAAVVTQLRHAEDAQRQSHERLEIALQAGNMGAWKWDINTGAVTWTSTLETIHGLPPGGFPGTFEAFQRDIHPDDRNYVVGTIRSILENPNDSTYRTGYRIIRPNGELAWLEATGQVVRDSNGKPLAMTGVCSDATSRVLAQRLINAEHTVTRVLSNAFLLDDAAHDILRAFGESVDGSIAELWIPEADGKHLKCAAIWTRPGLSGCDEFLKLSREILFERGVGLPGRVWSGEAAATIAEVTDDANFPRRHAAAAAGLRSGLAFPVCLGGEFLGVIEFFAQHRVAADENLLHTMTAIGRDIGLFIQRTRAEQALRESQRQLEDFFSNATVGLHLVDANGIILRANAAELDMLGYAASEYIGRNIAEFHVDAGRIADILARLRRGETLQAYESQMRCKDGSIKDVLIDSSALFRDGRFIHTRCFTRDITAQKHAERSLRDSEARLKAHAEELQAIMDAVPAIVWVAHDPECRLITGNRAAQELLRLPQGANASKTAPDDQRPTNFRVFRDGAEVPDDQLPVQLAARTGEPVFGQTYEIRFDDGSIAYEFGNAVPLFDDFGEVRGAVATFIDITSLKQAETELASLKDQLAADLAEMTRLHELSMRLLSTDPQDVRGLLQQVLEACAALLGTEQGNIQIFDEQDQALKIVAHMGFNDAFLERFKLVPIGYSVCGTALDRHQRVIVENAYADDRFADLAPEYEKFGFIAVQSTPLFSSDGRLLGMLSNHFPAPHRPSERELRLLDLYALQAARILERHRAEQALRKQNEQLQALYTLSQAVGRAEALDDIYRQCIDSLLRAIRADRASILLFDADNVMRFKAWHGLSEDYRRQVEGHSPWKRDQADATPLTIEDVATRTDLGHLRDVVLNEGIGALAFIPLASGGQLLGKFMLYFNQPHRFSDDEIQLARTIAGHVAFALERIVAQQQLRESEQISRRRLAELAAIYSDVPVGLSFINSDLRFVKVNPRFAQINGLSAEQMAGRRVDEVLALESEDATIIRGVIASGKPVLDREKSSISARGHQRDWLQSFCPVTDAAGEVVGVNCVVVDITERKRIEREIQHHRERLEELVAQRTADLEATHQRLRASERLAAMGTLSAGLGHDMGNLLLPMKSRLDVLQSLDLPKEVREHLHGIELCAKYLQDLVRGLRLFSQDPNEVGADAFTNLREWQLQTYPFYHSVLPRSIKLECDIPEDLPPVAIAPHALTQAVLNLVNNARDAIGTQRAGQVLMRARLESRPREGGDRFVRLALRDDGPGMSAEVKARALEPFFTTKTRSLSTGLGLSMVHGLARAAGGHVEIHSPPRDDDPAPIVPGGPAQRPSNGAPHPCRGTEIVLVLPVAQEVEPLDEQIFERPRAAISVSDPRTGAVLSSMLDSMGFQVTEANGKPDGGAVWFTEPSDQKLAAARAFLQDDESRAVVVIGDPPPEWHSLPIKTIDRTCKPSAIRAALAELVEELAGGKSG